MRISPPTLSATNSSSNPRAVSGSKERSILLVEDSLPLRTRLTEMLTVPGVMRVTAGADSAMDATREFAQQHFDVLIVDIELREGNGITVVKEARTRWLHATLPLIIVLTNYALPTIKERCLAAGANHFLDKMAQFDQVYPLIVNHPF